MSTKIYNGFRFKDKNIHTITKQLIAMQDEIEKYTFNEIARMIAKESVDVFDRLSLNLPVENYVKDDTPAWHAKKLFAGKEKEFKHSSYRDPLIDFTFEVTVIPTRMKEKFLGMYWCDRRDFVKMIESKPWFVDFHYQNQTDEPDGMSMKEWRRRELVWDSVVDYEPPARRGFTMTLHKKYMFMHPYRFEQIKEHIPTFKKRVTRQAENVLSKRWFARHKNEKAIGSLYRKWMDYLESSRGAKSLQTTESKLCKKMKKRITKTDLYGR